MLFDGYETSVRTPALNKADDDIEESGVILAGGDIGVLLGATNVKLLMDYTYYKTVVTDPESELIVTLYQGSLGVIWEILR